MNLRTKAIEAAQQALGAFSSRSTAERVVDAVLAALAVPDQQMLDATGELGVPDSHYFAIWRDMMATLGPPVTFPHPEDAAPSPRSHLDELAARFWRDGTVITMTGEHGTRFVELADFYKTAEEQGPTTPPEATS